MSFDLFETRMREHRKRSQFIIVMAKIVTAAFVVLIIGLIIAIIFAAFYLLKSVGAL